MKSLYWQPRRHSTRVIALVALVAVAAMLSVLRFRVKERQPNHAEKVRAAELTRHAFQVLKDERLRRGEALDPAADPSESGLIGRLISPITTGTGIAAAKQTSVNPNFAAVVVHLLDRAGVKPGDAVAVGLSGSFPALNVATLAAIETLGAKPVTIASVGASEWGANLPTLTWPDMERALVERNVLRHRSVAVSPGGVDDRALGLSEEGKQSITAAIARSGLRALEPLGLADSIEKRMAVYREAAGDAPIRAFVNVGGGTSTVGTRIGKELFKPGLNRTLPRGAPPDSVMARFVRDGIPVVHLSRIETLARDFGLPERPTTMPKVGEGAVYQKLTESRALAGTAIVLLVALMHGLLRLDLGRHLESRAARRREDEPMV
ncbi:MAG: poly-gamma-glutamate system protein [Deltaproteobacteria bacterium]|nr:poly-gamma-glutamate system protein [Deltaproteobacteria bacterium]